MTAGPVAVVAALPLVAFSGVLMVLAGAGASTPPEATVCGPGGTAATVVGVRLDADQLANARTIVTVAATQQLPSYAAVIAVTTAYTESTLRNTTIHTDHDSEGLFQQRISIYGKPVADDPVRATNAFLDRLLAVPGWRQQPVGVDAQAVQHSKYPARYEPNAALAARLVGQYWPTATATTARGSTRVVDEAAVCPGGGGQGATGRLAGSTGNVIADTTTVPAGLVIDGTPRAVRAVRYAIGQLGKPYVFGAAGPDAFDCSGLTLAAWAEAGVALPHLAAAQARAGTPTTVAAAVAGDLIFIPGSDGTPANPGHVGLVAGYLTRSDGRRLLLVQAPETGVPVELTEASEWSGQIVAVRHLG